MQRLSAAVVMYGGEEETAECLNSLISQTKSENFQLFLVDNASPENALEKLRKIGIPVQVETIELSCNKGFGTGHNAVLSRLNSQYHAVVNPDILLQEDALTAMADWMDQHLDVVVTCPRLVFPDGAPQYTPKRRPALLALIARQLNLRFLKKFEDHYLMLDEDLTNPIDIEFCSGSFFLIRTKAFKEMGGFDEKYFMYVEDADITQKALQCGRAVYLPHVSVTHAWHRAAHKHFRQFWWQFRSMFRYFKKWGFALT